MLLMITIGAYNTKSLPEFQQTQTCCSGTRQKTLRKEGGEGNGVICTATQQV